jgi:hypothetical protein
VQSNNIRASLMLRILKWTRRTKIVEQIVDSVNDLVESIANTASEALEPATESLGPKPKRQSVPDYEFPAHDSYTLSTPVKKPAAKKKAQLATTQSKAPPRIHRASKAKTPSSFRSRESRSVRDE